MTVYYITLAAVVLLLIIAHNQDYAVPMMSKNGIVHHSSQASFFYSLAVVAMIIVAGFRYRVGADYEAYYYNYPLYIKALPSALRKLDEPGYGILAWIATQFGNDGAIAIFFSSLVMIALPMIVIYRNTDGLLMAGYLYFVTCWSGGFNGIRQFLACSVLFCGYRSLKGKKLIQYLMWTFLAFLFHRSAIVTALIFFVVHRKVNWINILIMIVAAGVVLVSYDRIFSIVSFVMEKDYSLEVEYTARQVNRIRVIAACVPAVVFLLMYYGEKLNESESFYLNISILHAALRVFTMNSALLYRVGLYTSLFQIIAITELLKGIKSDSNRKFLTAGLVLMYLGMWWYEIYKSGSLNQFQWIWSR